MHFMTSIIYRIHNVKIIRRREIFDTTVSRLVTGGSKISLCVCIYAFVFIHMCMVFLLSLLTIEFGAETNVLSILADQAASYDNYHTTSTVHRVTVGANNYRDVFNTNGGAEFLKRIYRFRRQNVTFVCV